MHKLLHIIILSAFIVLSNNMQMYAHEGEDHGKPKASTSSQALTHFTSSSVSDKFELVLYYGYIEAGKETQMQLFLSDYATNTPIGNANIQLTLANDASKKFNVKQSDSGIYVVKGMFPENTTYNITANISAGNKADLMLIKNVELGKELPVADENKEDVETDDQNEISPIWYGLGGLFLGGIIIWLLMDNRRKISS